MRIFLTGSTGFIGKSLLDATKNQYTFYCYRRGEDIISCLDSFKPDIIVHSAAEIYNEQVMYESNVLLTRSILSWVIKNDVKLIYIGSSSEYGIKDRPMKEDDVCVPVSLYAHTKLIGTEDCIRVAKEYCRDVCIIRPFSLYGPNEPERRLIPTLYRSIKNNEQINLINGVHDFIYIDDFIDVIKLLLIAQRQDGQIYNVGFGKSYTNIDILNKMLSHIGSNYTAEIVYKSTKKACDSDIWVADNSKIYKKFNYIPSTDIDNGLTQYIYYKSCRHN